MNDDKMFSVEEAMLKEIEIREKLDPNHYYDAKLSSIKRAQEMGMSDADIQKAFNITIRPEDRQ